MLTTNNITLYQLMSEDLDVWVSRSDNFGFKIEIDDENGNPLVSEKGVHPSAAEGFAGFCRRYLVSYNKYKE